MPHARSSTSDPPGRPSSSTVWRRHPRSSPSEITRFMRSYVGATRSNMVSTDAALLVAFGQFARAAGVGGGGHECPSRGFVARRGELGRAHRPPRGAPARPRGARCGSGARRAWSRSGAASGTRRRGARRLLVVGQVGVLQRVDARARRTSRPRRRRSRASPRGDASRASSRSGSGKPASSRRSPERSTSTSSRVYPARPSCCWGTMSPSRTTASSERSWDADPRRQLVEVEELGVAVLGAGDGGRERHVGRRRARRRAGGGSPRARSPAAGGP